MSDAMTSVEVNGRPVYMVRGHALVQGAIDETREHYQREFEEAARILADLDAGKVAVFYQRGIHIANGRRQVHP